MLQTARGPQFINKYRKIIIQADLAFSLYTAVITRTALRKPVWSWVIEAWACCNFKSGGTDNAHHFLSIHSSHAQQHGVSLPIPLTLEVVNVSITLGKRPAKFTGTELHVRVGRPFQDLFFQVLFLGKLLSTHHFIPLKLWVSPVPPRPFPSACKYP